MKGNKLLKGLVALGIGYAIFEVGFQTGKGWILGSIKSAVNHISGDEIIASMMDALEDDRCSKVMIFAAKLKEDDVMKYAKEFEKKES